jgi:hypothetical protein
MSIDIKTMAVLAATLGSAGFLGTGVAQAEPPPGACGTPAQAVLWGDYCFTGNQQNQPPAPPSIAWDEGLGTLTAHITDQSGVASQCSYSSELVNRSFALPANGSFDLVIAPAVPAFRNWDVTVACDNGAVANTSKFF